MDTAVYEQNVISAPASVYKGISWLERHFTLDKEMWGTDLRCK